MAGICFIALVVFNPVIFAIFLAVMVVAVSASHFLAKPVATVPAPALDPAI